MSVRKIVFKSWLGVIVPGQSGGRAMRGAGGIAVMGALGLALAGPAHAQRSGIPVPLPTVDNINQFGGVSVNIGQQVMAASIPVTIASNQGALGVTQSGNWQMQLAAGSNLAGAFNLYVNGAANASANPLYAQITNLPATQPVSGSVSVSNLPATQTVSDAATVAINGKLAASGNGSDSTVTAPAALTQLASFTVANPGAYRIQNQSAGTIQYQLCATGGTGCTLFLLAPGAGANAQGADSAPEVPWFTGVINILGASGAQFAARHN